MKIIINKVEKGYMMQVDKEDFSCAEGRKETKRKVAVTMPILLDMISEEFEPKG